MHYIYCGKVNVKCMQLFILTSFFSRGVGTGETGEARASPEIRACLKSNSQIARKKNVGYSFFLGASLL